VRVGLADDSELFREGLAALLNASGIQVVLQVGSGRELLDQVGAAALDAAVIDIRMPPTFSEEGLDTADALGRSHPDLAVLVLSTYAETAYAVRVFRQGSARRGYLLKDALDHPEALRDALERLRNGGSVLDRSIVQRLISSNRCQTALAALTACRRGIVHLIAEGRTQDEIAVELGLDAATTQHEVAAALGQLGIRSGPESDRLVDVLTWLRSDPS
jgi:DNA-binding NarL/FixJ family response regulator